MGIYQGSLSFTRYRVLGETEKLTIAELSKLIKPFLAAPLRIDGPVKPESIGWVRPLTASDEELVGEDSHWDLSDCQVENGYLMRLRYERRRVSPNIMQMLYKQSLRDHLKKSGKNMPRAERQKLKDDLMGRTLPQLQFIDLHWQDADRELIIFTTGKAARQRAEQLFHQTFCDKLDLSLVRLDGCLAFLGDESVEEDDLAQRLRQWSAVEPVVFAPQRADV